MIGEASGKRPYDVELLFDLPQQQPAGIGSDPPAIKGGGHFAGPMSLEQQPLPVTLCHDETAFRVSCDVVDLPPLTRNKAVSLHQPGEKCGLIRRSRSQTGSQRVGGQTSEERHTELILF